MYDAIIVGARCAGAATAMLLARRGHKVLLVDRATFPSDLPHGHFIHRRGPARLKRWGLLGRVAATGAPPITSVTTDYGDFALSDRDVMVDGAPLGYGPRRRALDRILLDAAVESGADLRTGFAVQDYIGDGERIIGIRGREAAGRALVTEHATVTIGADGRNSRLARTVGAPVYEELPPLTCWYFSYWSGIPDPGLQLHLRERRLVLAFPADAGLVAIFAAWPASMLPQVRADIPRHFMGAVDAVPGLGEQVRAGRQEDRYYGASDLANFLRRPYGPGWALVGDAGCHKDPFLALGMCDAFRDAELLTNALDEAFTGLTPLETALAGYHRKRDRATVPDYQLNALLARTMAAPEPLLRVRAEVREDPRAIRRLTLMNQGVREPDASYLAAAP
ncbi:MAG TPA: NAD(P)/FAD-dependent oxidoreductase [Gemmatimonadales bacterium]|jgi:flavin-dependent dehydrogenase|nr:NAD(P)/FAD-dependent oxidoreductase [Gemmatimonadales bacterium]